jgi:hypothetical protein
MIMSHFSSVSVTTRVSTNLPMSRPSSWLCNWITPAPSRMLNKADTKQHIESRPIEATKRYIPQSAAYNFNGNLGAIVGICDGV